MAIVRDAHLIGTVIPTPRDVSGVYIRYVLSYSTFRGSALQHGYFQIRVQEIKVTEKKRFKGRHPANIKQEFVQTEARWRYLLVSLRIPLIYPDAQ